MARQAAVGSPVSPSTGAAVSGRDASLAATRTSDSQDNNDPDNQTSHGDAGDAGDTSTDQNANAAPQEQGQAPSGTAAALIMVPLCLSVTMSALDLTIVTPAIPAMVSAFQSETGYVWIGSAFILASTASTPVWGSVANIWGRKPIMLISVAVFVLGSLLCAIAKNMDALLAGRTIQGLGASGMGTMVNVIICDTFSLRDRGLYLAITSIVWAVASAVGPVVGGIFTTTLR